MWSFITKNKNDVIYLSLLLFSVVIGPYYRQLKTVEAKKWAGSILGLLLIVIVSGYSAAHPICSALFGITIIKAATQKRCHVVTFFFMFGYLFVFRLADKFGLPSSSGQTNLIEMIIVLRVVGVAFEINGSYLSMKRLKKKEKRLEREAKQSNDTQTSNLDDSEVEKEARNKNIAETDAKEKPVEEKDVGESDVKDSDIDDKNVKESDTEEKDRSEAPKRRHRLIKRASESSVRQRKLKEKHMKEKEAMEQDIKDNEPEERKDYDFVELIDPDFIDLFHYSFNYCGLLTGPYYRYRTFDDYFRLPFSKYVDCFGFTVNTLKTVPLYISLYLAFSNIWPLEYVLTEEHNNRHFFYRMMYPWALFAAFRQRIYAGMTLAESVCTSAGLGAYPVQGRNRSGHGPTVGYLRLKEMPEEEAKKAQYDFNTVESMDVWGCETTVTLRDSMKVWNKAVQYWVAMVVYKRFPVKPLKIHAALFVSVIWHGFHAGYFFCIYACPFYLMAEDIYYKLFYVNATGTKRKVVGFIMWFLRSHSESYQAAAFLLLTFDRIWTYYSSVHHYWYGCWLAFLLVGLVMKKARKYLQRIELKKENRAKLEEAKRLLENENESNNGGIENEEAVENQDASKIEGEGIENKDKGDGNVTGTVNDTVKDDDTVNDKATGDDKEKADVKDNDSDVDTGFDIVNDDEVKGNDNITAKDDKVVDNVTTNSANETDTVKNNTTEVSNN